MRLVGQQEKHIAQLNTLRYQGTRLWRARRSHLVALDAGDALRQGGPLRDGKVVHHLVGGVVLEGLETQVNKRAVHALHLQMFT